MPSSLQEIVTIQTAREWVRHWYAFGNPVGKVIKTRVRKPLLELVYNFTMIENLFLLVEVKHFTNFSL